MPDLSFVPAPRPAPVPAPAPRTAPDARPAATGAARPVAFVPLAGSRPSDAAERGAGYAAGWAAGHAAGARRAAQEAAQEAERQRAVLAAEREARAAEHQRSAAALALAAEAMRAAHAPVLASALDAVRSGALELAQAVLGHELSDASAAARAALTRVLGAPGLPDELVVRLHPRDLDALAADELATLPPGVRLVADAALAPGDAVAQHADGELDARVGAALDRVRAALGTA